MDLTEERVVINVKAIGPISSLAVPTASLMFVNLASQIKVNGRFQINRIVNLILILDKVINSEVT